MPRFAWERWICTRSWRWSC